jgi:hypothetical protein
MGKKVCGKKVCDGKLVISVRAGRMQCRLTAKSETLSPK